MQLVKLVSGKGIEVGNSHFVLTSDEDGGNTAILKGYGSLDEARTFADAVCTIKPDEYREDYSEKTVRKKKGEADGDVDVETETGLPLESESVE